MKQLTFILFTALFLAASGGAFARDGQAFAAASAPEAPVSDSVWLIDVVGLLLLFVGVPLVLGWLFFRRHLQERPEVLQRRLDALRALQANLAQSTAQLAEDRRSARLPSGEVGELCLSLMEQGQDASERGQGFADGVKEAEQAFAQGKRWRAQRLIARFEGESLSTGVEMAALVAALGQLRTGDLSGEQARSVAGMPALARRLSKRLVNLHAVFLGVEREARNDKRPRSEEAAAALASATQRLLDGTSWSPDQAKQCLDEAEKAIKKYQWQITSAYVDPSYSSSS